MPSRSSSALVAAPALAHPHAAGRGGRWRPEQRSISLRAAVPIASHHPARPCRPGSPSATRSRPTRAARTIEQAVLALLDLVDLDLHRVRHLLAGAQQHLLAHQLGERAPLGDWSVLLLGRVVERALRQQRDERLHELGHARRRCAR